MYLRTFDSAQQGVVYGDGCRGFHTGNGTGDDAGIVPPDHPQGGRRHGVQVHAPLLPGDGGRGLKRRPEGEGHPVGNAAQNAAAAVGDGADLPILHGEGVVIHAAPQPCGFKADAELNALDGGYAEHDGGNAVLHTAEQRAAQTCGQTQHGTFHHAAYGVTLRLGGGNSRRHGQPPRVV